MSSFLYIAIGILYILVFSFLVYRASLKKEGVAGSRWLTTAFVLKVAAGMIYGYIYAHYFEVSDSWAYFKESLEVYREMLRHPVSFFDLGLQPHYLGSPFSSADDAFWSNAGENLLIRLLALFNILSGGNYYINVIFFNAISFWGLYFIYRVAKDCIPANPRVLFGIIFFLPACLFWNSGIDKDGIMVFFTGALIFTVYRCIGDKATILRMFIGLACMICLLLLRNINGLLLLPGLVAWWIASKRKMVSWLPFLFIYGFCVLFFFGSAFLPDHFNLPLQLSEKQHRFLELEAHTVLPLTPLEPGMMSYLRVLPEAVNHVFLRPYITEIRSLFHLMAFFEGLLVIGILVFSLLKGGRQQLAFLLQPFSLFVITLALSGLLVIGYTVPFPGAIIRYKALHDVLLLLPFARYIAIKYK
ncbi:MAG: hypothetical protein M9933_15535 [Chitinophagaceae bacterium]|nr:hypothetical protein [Chitinophagaceae bacterium]